MWIDIFFIKWTKIRFPLWHAPINRRKPCESDALYRLWLNDALYAYMVHWLLTWWAIRFFCRWSSVYFGFFTRLLWRWRAAWRGSVAELWARYHGVSVSYQDQAAAGTKTLVQANSVVFDWSAAIFCFIIISKRRLCLSLNVCKLLSDRIPCDCRYLPCCRVHRRKALVVPAAVMLHCTMQI